ncbi:serine/arginine-rich SC35-like splicing factor SCL30A, partial [Tanacetum coccineum]
WSVVENFVEPADAEEAKYHMDGQILMGRQMTVVFAEENRKKPSDMRLRERRTDSRFSNHHVPAVITLLHPEEGTTQGHGDEDRSPSHDGAHRSPSRIPVNE